MVLIHLSGAFERVRLGGAMSRRVLNTIAWHLSGLTLSPYFRKNPPVKVERPWWRVDCLIY